MISKKPKHGVNMTSRIYLVINRKTGGIVGICADMSAASFMQMQSAQDLKVKVLSK